MTTFDSIIRGYLREEGKNSLHGYDDYREFLWSGIQDISWETDTPAILLLQLNDMRIIPLPKNVKKAIEVGYIFENYFIPIQEDNRLSRVDTDDCGELVLETGIPTNYISDFNMHERIGENIGANFGVGSIPTTGSYKIWPDNYLQISIDFPKDRVAVKYLKTLDSTDVFTEVPEVLIEPLKAWIEYARIRRKRNAPRGLIRELEMIYNQKKTVALRRKQGFTPAQAVAAIRSGFMQAPKI